MKQNIGKLMTEATQDFRSLDKGEQVKPVRFLLQLWDYMFSVGSYYISFENEARVKGNLRNWLHFLNLRNDNHAQYEIRQYAIAIESVLEQIAPLTVRFYREHRMNRSKD